MTRLLVLSDLHLEQEPAWTLPKAFPPFDVAVFAGDVDAPADRAVHRLAEAPGLAGRPIVYVPGNHEHYRGCLEERVAAGQAACAGTRVRLLDRATAVLAGVRFVGATLWTDYRLGGDQPSAMAACRRKLPDHRLIEVGSPGARRLFRPQDAAALHAADRAFIEAELERPFNGATVVVTHHAPHPGSIAARFSRDRTTPGFASDLASTIRRGCPALWVHGHVHASVDYRVGVTRVLANPRGFDRRGSPENVAFDGSLVLEVPIEGWGYDAGAIAVLHAGMVPKTWRIACWTVLRVRADGDRYALGYRVDNGRGRTSSPIRAFDPATMTATTSSGNRYELIGAPSVDGLDDELVRAWLAQRGLSRHDVEIEGEDP